MEDNVNEQSQQMAEKEKTDQLLYTAFCRSK